MSEVWRDVVGYEGLYQVSDAGGVRSLDREIRQWRKTRRMKGRVLKPRINHRRRGYHTVHLSVDQVKVVKYIHHLVLEAFVGPRPGDMEGCHDDGDPANNTLGNLRWDTHVANVADQIRHGTHRRGERSGTAKVTASDVIEIRRRAPHALHRELAVEFGISRQQVDKIVNGQRWAHI